MSVAVTEIWHFRVGAVAQGGHYYHWHCSAGLRLRHYQWQ
jgi:hypothetical protein